MSAHTTSPHRFTALAQDLDNLTAKARVIRAQHHSLAGAQNLAHDETAELLRAMLKRAEELSALASRIHTTVAKQAAPVRPQRTVLRAVALSPHTAA